MFYVKFKYEKLKTFCYLCGSIGHTDTFCKLRLHRKPKELVAAWDESLRAQPHPRSNQLAIGFIIWKVVLLVLIGRSQIGKSMTDHNSLWLEINYLEGNQIGSLLDLGEVWTVKELGRVRGPSWI